jgi:phenylalanyl-tRNA synthetase alpha chain
MGNGKPWDGERPFTKSSPNGSAPQPGHVLSAHTLTHAKVPGKYFGVVRLLRSMTRWTQPMAPISPDGRHHGSGEDATSVHSLGLPKMFATENRRKRRRSNTFRLFPFTERPSRCTCNPVLGWFELGGRALFRTDSDRTAGHP